MLGGKTCYFANQSFREIKAAFPNTPIIGNGDVASFQEFEYYKEYANVDSVMSGYEPMLFFLPYFKLWGAFMSFNFPRTKIKYRRTHTRLFFYRQKISPKMGT
ncbi:tRNA-dihydrouridine synthase [Patescibacteria group bacterium]|nr:tRNA-dihydrouridine synthase [Patescibacteria group bacterium]